MFDEANDYMNGRRVCSTVAHSSLLLLGLAFICKLLRDHNTIEDIIWHRLKVPFFCMPELAMFICCADECKGYSHNKNSSAYLEHR